MINYFLCDLVEWWIIFGACGMVDFGFVGFGFFCLDCFGDSLKSPRNDGVGQIYTSHGFDFLDSSDSPFLRANQSTKNS